ncbi:SDR family NAD(P)-dependent oxidoreductase [Pseudovibrio sp. JE062]|uniref:SDR family NAD(P)-dependent oxidoreductase n=1 Tax=Pseudovibrio sp. JE062 TaxID=439495 RepID=UPI000186C34A|nr:3-oxoacyl-ACP reductase family protein [Pseudovibrio sp. JE062]EEA92932.1 3-oxoacyl-(acyl-carrier-protein) reductase [Pseudovibrio sp. JE062]
MSASNSLSDKVAVVTGASRGIGAAIARRFAEEGATVFLNSRTEGALDEVAKHLTETTPGTAYPIYFDVTDADAVKNAFMAVKKQIGRVDVLVNNAGVMHSAVVSMTSDDHLREMMKVNYEGTFFCSRIASRLMTRQKSGSIINVSSIIGCVGVEGNSAYAASKAAILGFSKSLAKELAPSNIRVNVIAPGFIETDLTQDITGDRREKVMGQILMGRPGLPEDVANAAFFLASDLASYITGQTIGVDGCMVT